MRSRYFISCCGSRTTNWWALVDFYFYFTKAAEIEGRGEAQVLSFEAITLFQLFLAARCLLNSSSICSSVSLCPEIAYHVTVAIPSVAVSTHLNHTRMKHVGLGLSMGWGLPRERTHPNIAPIPLGLHPKICGNGPSGKPLRSFGFWFPAALPCVGRSSVAHWSLTYCGTDAFASSGVASTNTAAKPCILRESDRVKGFPKWEMTMVQRAGERMGQSDDGSSIKILYKKDRRTEEKCQSMWQWKNQAPGLSATNRRVAECIDNT